MQEIRSRIALISLANSPDRQPRKESGGDIAIVPKSRLSRFFKRIKPKARPEELFSRSFEGNEVSMRDKLCEKCTSLDLSISSFYVVGDEQDTMVIDAVELGTVAEVRNRIGCPLCRLVMRSLDGHPAYLQTFGIYLPSIKCKLVWNTDRFSGLKEKELVRLKRHLSLLLYTDRNMYVPIHVPLRLVPLSNGTSAQDSFGLAIKADSMDFKLIESWIQDCESTHSCVSRIRFLADPPVLLSHFILLDVQQMCLVRTGIDKCRFLALSYVWGSDVEDFRTTRANVKDLMQYRGLEKYLLDLPATIRDAFELVLKLGERYIWIDKLCIIQDDLVNKQDILDAMGIIYGKSLVTIIPADSNTAADGIAGLSQAIAVRGQIIERITEDLELIALPDLVTKLQNSCYSTRAWTYQESFFAPRRLFVIDGRAMFVCTKSALREDVCAIDRKRVCVEDLEEIYGTRLGLGFDYRFAYGIFVTNYTRRQLSYDSDALNAFSGFKSLLGAHNHIRFYFGLPESHLDSSIVWQPSRPLRRRKGPFPSWSWCGWSGAVETYVFMWHPQHAPRDAPKPDWIVWYAWYLMNGRGEFQPVKGPEILRSTNSEPDLVTKPTEKVQKKFRDRIDINGLLTFWSVNARFRTCNFPQSQVDPYMSVDEMTKGGSSPKESSSTTLLGLEDRNGRLCGAIYINTDVMVMGQMFEVIAIRESMEKLLRRREGHEHEDSTFRKQDLHEEGDDTIDERIITRTSMDWGCEGNGNGVFEVLVVAPNAEGSMKERLGVGEVFKQAFKRAYKPGCQWSEVTLG